MTRQRLPASLALALLAGSAPAWAAVVNVSAQLTTFQSALATGSGGGNGTLNGTALGIDKSLPDVTYAGDPGTPYHQSEVVALAAGTTEVVFHYSDVSDPAFFNRVSFAPAGPSNVKLGEVFKVGTITYQNGFWYPYARVGLHIELSSADVALNGHTFEGAIVVAVSSPVPFVMDPVSNADYFYLADASAPLAALGSVRVYEGHIQPADNPGNVGAADLYARIGSLVPVRFDNPSSAAFLSTSLDPINAVPEPGTWALWMAGALGLLGMGRRRRKAS